MALERVDVGTQSIANYAASAGADRIGALREAAADLAGLRVLHVSATPYGGGVAEILRSKVPLLRDLGIVTDWMLIRGDEEFFSVTKAIHDGLQGSPRVLSAAEQQRYLSQSARNAEALDCDTYDIVVVHDPQPLPLLELHGRSNARWIWRCHIDTSEPNPQVWAFLRPFVVRYDLAVFTLGGFVPPDFPVKRVEIVPPAIDPESPKNLELGDALTTRVLEWIGVETRRPLVAQVSRFDPWKDPFGVIAAYRLMREHVSDLQLALVGSMALDDPDAWNLFRAIQDETVDDEDVHLFTNFTGVGNVEVNALQRRADVIIQKSLREGFGLVVSESLWKATPVVAGHAGGIPLQLQDGRGGYLVDSIEECASRTVELLDDPELRQELGHAGKELVRERFLLPRLIADELRLYREIAVDGARDDTGELRLAAHGEPDPVCGMRIDPTTARALTYGERTHYFCSRTCEEEFARDPERFVRHRLLRSGQRFARMDFGATAPRFRLRRDDASRDDA
jgi:trehalose synthase